MLCWKIIARRRTCSATSSSSSPAEKAGARAFPLMIPTTPDAPGAAEGSRVLEALRTDERPMLLLWADSDPIMPVATGERFAAALGRERPRIIEAISEARSHGDLSENAEYHAAKEAQSLNEGRVNELEDLMGVEIELISGFPSMEYAHVLSPASLSTAS